MNYRKSIHPSFRCLVWRLPFRPWLLRAAYPVLGAVRVAWPVPRGVRRRILSVPGGPGPAVPTELLEPAGAEGCLPCLLDIHGGGFGYRASAYNRTLACRYALGAGCRVLFPDYRLLPEHPFPAACDDVRAVYTWALSHAEELRIDPERIAVMGDSAGGALAAHVCNTAQRAPCLQMLLYPVTDAAQDTESLKTYRDAPLWSAENNRRMWELYLADAGPRERALASPMQNPLPAQVPDTYVETAQFDCLHDEGVRYAERLRAAGAQVELRETKGTLHGYDAALRSPVSQESLRRRTAVLRRAFYG